MQKETPSFSPVIMADSIGHLNTAPSQPAVPSALGPSANLRSAIKGPEQGALDGGPQCRMSILGNGNVACPCCLFSPMSHVEFKRLCHMSL